MNPSPPPKTRRSTLANIPISSITYHFIWIHSSAGIYGSVGESVPCVELRAGKGRRVRSGRRRKAERSVNSTCVRFDTDVSLFLILPVPCSSPLVLAAQEPIGRWLDFHRSIPSRGKERSRKAYSQPRKRSGIPIPEECARLTGYWGSRWGVLFMLLVSIVSLASLKNRSSCDVITHKKPWCNSIQQTVNISADMHYELISLILKQVS